MAPSLGPFSITQKASAGVGRTPTSSNFAPPSIKPEQNADFNVLVEALVSPPTTIFPPPFSLTNSAVARPNALKKGSLISKSPYFQRIPSVPKYFIFCASFNNYKTNKISVCNSSNFKFFIARTFQKPPRLMRGPQYKHCAQNSEEPGTINA